MGYDGCLTSPCAYSHPTKDFLLAFWGDDFVAVGMPDLIDDYETQLGTHIEVVTKARLGWGPKCQRQGRLLNRLITVKENAVEYEADPRHGELMVQELGLETAREQKTPGVVKCRTTNPRSRSAARRRSATRQW